MTEDLVPCKRCGSLPKIVAVGDLFYAQCDGTIHKKVNAKNMPVGERDTCRTIKTKCDKWGAYEFLGITKQAAIHNWNRGNSRNVTKEEDILW